MTRFVKTHRLVLAVAAVASFAGGAAFAGIPDSAGVIHACYSKDRGDLYVTDTGTGTPRACTGSETPLSWNTTGPRGPQGATGAQGPTGPSDGYLAPTPSAVTIGAVSSPTSVASLLVRDGNYLVTGVVALRNPTTTAETVDCFLVDADHGQGLPGSAGTLNYVTVPAGGAAQSTAIGSTTLTGLVTHRLELRCVLLPGGGAQVWTRGVLEAVKVGTLNPS